MTHIQQPNYLHTYFTEADSEPNRPLSRVQRSGRASPYWWIPGSTGNTLTFSHISCGDPSRPRHGSSLFESVQAGAIVIHSCNPGYKLVGAKLRLCQSNGRWTPELPQCVCKLQSHALGQKLILSGLAYKGHVFLDFFWPVSLFIS